AAGRPTPLHAVAECVTELLDLSLDAAAPKLLAAAWREQASNPVSGLFAFLTADTGDFNALGLWKYLILLVSCLLMIASVALLVVNLAGGSRPALGRQSVAVGDPRRHRLPVVWGGAMHVAEAR